MKNQTKGYLFGLIAILLWSTVASAFKVSLNYFAPAQLLLYSSITSILTLGSVIVIQNKAGKLFSYHRKIYLKYLIMGILNPFVYFILLFKAYALLPAQEAQPLTYTWPFTMTILSVFILKQKITLKDIVAGIICYSGILIISTQGNILEIHFSSTLGVVFALASTVIWAIYWIYNTKDNDDPVIALFFNFLFALPFIFIYCLLTCGTGYATVLNGYLGAIYVGVFEMGITFVFWLMALNFSENTSKIMTLNYITPFLSLFFIHFIVGESIFISTIIGMIVVVGGLVFQQVNLGFLHIRKPKTNHI